MPPNSLNRYEGVMFGLAVGDASGAPVEFMSHQDIRNQYGPAGITGLVAWHGFPAGSYTDDTQMSLATAEGLIRARQNMRNGGTVPTVTAVYHQYLAWLETQSDPKQTRAPGNTCLSALQSGTMGSIHTRLNNSKGCGGVMRTAPVGLAQSGRQAFQLGAECAAITHSHPTGYLSAGYLSQLVSHLVEGETLPNAMGPAHATLIEYDGHEETTEIVVAAERLAASDVSLDEGIEQLGKGWVGEEALAISLFCALRFPTDWKAAVIAAVNHSGDSDSTGSICGAILGASLGVEAIPVEWREQVENRDYLAELANDLHRAFVLDEELSFDRYPPD